MLLNRRGRRIALAFLSSIDGGSTMVLRINEVDEEQARAIIRRYSDKDFSLTDATSFAVADRIGIRSAFSFDRNFSQYGLNVLQP
jgi:predicted nucleic acid-binding protein